MFSFVAKVPNKNQCPKSFSLFYTVLMHRNNKKVPYVLPFFFIVQKVITHHWPTRLRVATHTPIPTPNRQIKALASNNRSKGRKGSQPPHQFAQKEIAILLQHKQAPMSFAWHIAHLSP